MMNSSRANPLFGILPKEMRLAGQAKSGDANAFVNLYDACVERVYRYIYFLVPNTRAAEVLTFQVFFKAWGQLDHYQMFSSSFIVWLYSIVQDQIIVYYRTYKKAVDPDDDFTMKIKGGGFRKEFQVVRDGLHFLTAEQQQVLVLKFIVGVSNKNIGRVMARRTGEVATLLVQGLQEMTEYLQKTELKIEMKGSQRIFEDFLTKLASGASILDECWARYPEYSDQLGPLLETALLLHLGRDVKPLPTFTTYTHDALIQYIRSHPPRPKIIITPAFRRTALTFAMLIVTFLVTGTAQAQSALPGEPFYAWKRVSEQAWRAMSPNPAATDIVLAERRLAEWIAVAHDPTYNVSAKNEYLEVVARLESTSDVKTLAQVVPALQLQQQTLDDAGLPTSELDDYLVDMLVPIAPTAIVPTATLTSTATATLTSTATETLTSTATATLTSTATETLTSTATATLTSTATATLTSTATFVPTATEVPTEVVPTETEVPTEVVPTETEVPTKAVPTVAPTFTLEAAPTEQIP